jgi:hypothetical protein
MNFSPFTIVLVLETKQILESMLTANCLNPETKAELLHWYTLFNKNQAAWYVIQPAHAVT